MDDSQGKPHNLNWSEEMYKLIEDMFDADTFEGNTFQGLLQLYNG